MISAGRLAASIEALPTAVHPNLKHGTWCVRYIEGGNKNTLTVPDNCYLFVERFVVPGEDEDSCIRQIKDAAVSVGLAGKVDVSLRPRSLPYMWRGNAGTLGRYDDVVVDARGNVVSLRLWW